ncbi:Protein CBG04701 [Caenorhabditis briggsae]|uniref:Protein CBG04701 n=1 Tax=Caenorhabditis briggsae TaxID=6238 RepID=A8WY96_CAEBR|nr:Protein CBG04701 [Caenorhabditis briggsae]CAP25354.1 Protein CBG04701 [Caenorhabditis briggsae]
MALVQMPDKVLQQVVKNCELTEIQSLRKVCHKFRNIIEDFKPNYLLRRLDIDLRENEVLLDIYTNAKNTRWLRFLYEKQSNGCLITSFAKFVEKGEKLVKNAEFLNVFFEDLKHILMSQTTSLESFHIGFTYNDDDLSGQICKSMEENEARFLFNIQKILNDRRHPLLIEDFAMTMINQNQVMHVLPFVDPKELRRITFQHSHHRDCLKVFEMTDIVITEQWKGAKEIAIRDFLVDIPKKHFEHFKDKEVNHVSELRNAHLL